MNERVNGKGAKLGLAGLLVALFVLAAPGTAMAHARLVKSSPKSGAELSQAPAGSAGFDLLEEVFMTFC